MLLLLPRDAGTASPPRWARTLHAVGTTLITVPLAVFINMRLEEGESEYVGPALWVWAVGCVAMYYALSQLSPKRRHSDTA